MKRFLSIIICLALLSLTLVKALASDLSIYAEKAVLYCADNGEIYYSKNENKISKPASTTKIMTALLTLEYAEKNNKHVKFTEEMTAEGSSMYLKLGEVVTLRDLAVGIMLCSGNDAANAAAISISGSKEKFARMMTRRAREIGMKNTNFVNPSGLDDPDHYTTPYDMALLMAEALRNSDFRRLTMRKTAAVSFIKPKNKITAYSNHNRLLSTYRHCIGGKTGYTQAAGRCLVSAAKKDGLTLIAVTFNDKRDWEDHRAMFNYGFENYRMKELDDREFFIDVDTVSGKTAETAVSCSDISCVVFKAEDCKKVKRKIYMDNFLYAPVKSGDKVGKIVYTLNNKRLAVHTLRAAANNNSYIENKSIFAAGCAPADNR